MASIIAVFPPPRIPPITTTLELRGSRDDTWRVAYIEYSSRPKHYRICKADKYLRNFSEPVDIQGVTGPQHGSFMRLTKKEYKRLQKWSAKEMKKKKAE